MKRVFALLLCFIMLISVTACGSNYDPYTDPDLNAPNAGTNIKDEKNPNEQTVYDIIGVRATDYDLTNIKPHEFVGALGLGWNMGNTFDATLGKYDDPKSQEVSWGNPLVTKELIKLVADYGFTSIRIPITWYTYCDADYNINPAYLERIQEVVDYALDCGLFVIINTHHECENWLIPTKEKYAETSRILCKLWTQIGEHFKNYDERLIFEAMNEPRLVSGDWREWTGDDTMWTIVNDLDLDFVKTIRELGDKNETRFLMVPCYAATSNSAAWRLFKFPEDDDRVIVSVHAYTPYNFALNINGTSSWSSENGADTREINALFEDIERVFLRKGHEVIIGEFGAMSKNGNLQERIDWVGYYLSQARKLGVPCFLWDNNAFNDGETFGVIRRAYMDTPYITYIEKMVNTWYNSDFHFKIVNENSSDADSEKAESSVES